ncbi:MAG: ATP synthase F1 subunit delta [Gemmatimonadetes bacterium]|nr:ATP synthase F1 subunit delta [Gemmatimonadota bacterium]
MRDQTVARSYAETLFELARRQGAVADFEAGINSVAQLISENPQVREFVETPRISSEAKKQVLGESLDGRVPKILVNFVKVVIDKRRQRLLRSIASEFQGLVDDHAGRTHVDVTVARSLSQPELDEIAAGLSKALGKTVIPHLYVRPDILGGIVVRTGDSIFDGSIRRQIENMRKTLLAAELPAPVAE